MCILRMVYTQITRTTTPQPNPYSGIPYNYDHIHVHTLDSVHLTHAHATVMTRSHHNVINGDMIDNVFL